MWDISTFLATVWSKPGDYFLEPSALKALFALLPLLILYLIRPRPKMTVFPSLMFILGEKGKQKRNSFLQYLLRNLLLLLQILVIVLLALSLAKPFVDERIQAQEGSAIFVLDISASMQTWISPIDTRFSHAKSLIKEHATATNSLILAGRTPSLHLRDVSYDALLSSLATVQPADTATNLRDAMLLAGEVIGGQKGKVIVISDFLETDLDVDLSVVRSTLKARGIKVEFVSVHSLANNVGIIRTVVEEQATKVFVKNFDAQAREVTVRIGDQEKQLSIEPDSVQVVGFTTPEGTFKVELSSKDDFPLDDVAHFVLPEQGKQRTLIITNNAQTSHLERALRSIPSLEATRAVPPVVPDITHEIIVLKDVDKDLFLKGKIDEIRAAVEQGSLLIVAIQQDLFTLDFEGALPIAYESSFDTEKAVVVDNEHALMADISIGALHKGMLFSLIHPDARVLASVGDSPLIVFEPIGQGGILFYGIQDESNSFAQTVSYPLLWSNVAEMLAQKRSAHFLNTKTGGVLPFENPTTVMTPKGVLTTSNLALLSQGVYSFGDIHIAANLLDEVESDVAREISLDDAIPTSPSESSQTLLEKKEMTQYLLIAAFVLILCELFFVKYRGDL